MSSLSSENYQLTDEQRHVLKFLLNQNHTPKKIIDEWDAEYHKRKAPSLKTIYEINNRMKQCVSVDKKKKVHKEGQF